MGLSDSQEDRFSKYAGNPETWLISARRHLAVAELLLDRFEALMKPWWGEADAADEFQGCHYAWLLHAGLAVETAARAALIAADPTIVANGPGGFKKKFRLANGHEITVLVPAALRGELLSDDDSHTLHRLEEYVVWLGKYTVPMSCHVLYDQATKSARRTALFNERGIVRGLVERLTDRAKAPA